MICPFRNGIAYDIKVFNTTPVVVSQEEFYPKCYEEECPYYDYYNKCKAIDDDD